MITPLRAALQSGRTAFGVWNTLPGAAAVRTMAATPGISVRYPYYLSKIIEN